MRKEKYIYYNTGQPFVRLRIRLEGADVSRSYSIQEYGSPAVAMRAAAADRDQILAALHNRTLAGRSGRTFAQVYDEMKDLYPKRVATFVKYDKLHRKYLSLLDDRLIGELTAADIMLCLNI
jgi:hypothetical protein